VQIETELNGMLSILIDFGFLLDLDNAMPSLLIDFEKAEINSLVVSLL
jgi:hypothetical protein